MKAPSADAMTTPSSDAMKTPSSDETKTMREPLLKPHFSEGSSDETKTMREPLLKPHFSKGGGFRTLPFILANEAFEKVANLGLHPNMILYLTKEYGMQTAEAANVIFFWSAATNFTPIIGAFLADSYVGKYRMIGFGSILCFLGMVLLWLTAMFPGARPHCDQFSSICEPPTTPQLLFLYSSMGLMSIGTGGIRSSSMAFGADQLDTRTNPANAEALQSYFNWYYASVSLSALVAVTGIVYIQENMGWKMGFGVPAMLMFMSALSFYLASSLYVKVKPRTSLFTGLAQVLVASFRNRHMDLQSQTTNEVFYLRKGSVLDMPSEKLRFLNKACVTKNPQQDITWDGNASNPWNLCTIDQVEELKRLIRVIPLWSAGIMMSVAIAQSSFIVIQARTMDRHVTPKFEIPVGSFGMFLMIALILWIAFYDRIAIPLASKLKGKPVRLSLKQRMGIGLVCSCASMVTLAIVEYIRRKIAIQEGHSDEPQAPAHMSALWLLPYYVLGGLAEAFTGIGQVEFFYSELPKTMSSIAANLFGFGEFAANLVASFISSRVDDVTKRSGESWISSNINKGHYDYYYWLVAGLGLLNIMYYLACSKAYGPCRGDAEGQAQASRTEDHERIDEHC